MKGSQWFVLGMGLLVIGMFMFFYANVNCAVFSLGESLLTCRYSYSRPAIILGLLGMLFLVCSFLESMPKKN